MIYRMGKNTITHIMAVKIRDIEIGGGRPFALIAGPCSIESEQMCLEVAGRLKDICHRLGIPYIFKASFDKANRTSGNAPRGVGIDEGLRILQIVKDTLDLPVITDVHESWQCGRVAKVADVLQIPAFLCRQTDLLVAAAKTGKAVNIKKGQFLAPWDMRNVVDKIRNIATGGIMVTERGSSFGYNNLVVDMTSLVEMRTTGVPVVFDATHSVQKPGGMGGSTGGNRDMVPHLMRAALAVGIDALFAEIHPDPDHAWSDGPNQLRLDDAEKILSQAVAIDRLIKNQEPVIGFSTTHRFAELPLSGGAVRSERPDIRLVLTDVDGVLTDGGMYYSGSGDTLKRFQVIDGMGMKRLQKAGIKVGIITSEDTPIVRSRFEKLQLDYLRMGQGFGGKLAAAKQICEELGITLDNVAYIGDDVNCVELLEAVGLAACPPNAMPEVKSVSGIRLLRTPGGKGAFREFAEMIIKPLAECR